MAELDMTIKGLCEAVAVIEAKVPKRYWGYSVAAIQDAVALLKAQEPIEARLHLCDSCKKQYPECDATKDGVAFGSGTGNDNIVGCTAYVNRWKAQEPTSTPEAEWLLYKGTKGATCSYCKHTYYDVYDVEYYDYYCRHCGAKMIRMRTVKWGG